MPKFKKQTKKNISKIYCYRFETWLFQNSDYELNRNSNRICNFTFFFNSIEFNFFFTSDQRHLSILKCAELACGLKPMILSIISLY